MSVLVINPVIHSVRETPVAKFFRRQLRDSSILTFWNAETEQWVLAHWLRRGVVEEIEDLGSNFEWVTNDFVDMITGCYGHVDLGRTKKRLLARQQAQIQRQTDDIMEEQETWGWLRGKSKDKVRMPYMLQAG